MHLNGKMTGRMGMGVGDGGVGKGLGGRGGVRHNTNYQTKLSNDKQISRLARCSKMGK